MKKSGIKNFYLNRYITREEYESCLFLQSLANDIEKSGIGIDYTKFQVMVQTSGVGCRQERILDKLHFYNRIMNLFQADLLQEKIEYKNLQAFLDYILLEHSLKYLQNHYKIKKIVPMVIDFSKCLNIYIKSLENMQKHVDFFNK